MGIGLFGGSGQQVAYNPNPSGLQNNLQNNTAMANNAYAQNQAAFQHQQMMMNKWNQARMPKAYRFNGTDMDAEEFANTIFPDDCPEKTYLLLKMKGDEK